MIGNISALVIKVRAKSTLKESDDFTLRVKNFSISDGKIFVLLENFIVAIMLFDKLAENVLKLSKLAFSCLFNSNNSTFILCLHFSIFLFYNSLNCLFRIKESCLLSIIKNLFIKELIFLDFFNQFLFSLVHDI